MNINALPDLCLLTIFSNHNLKQQLANATICTRWRHLQHKLFLSQKSLTLVVPGTLIPGDEEMTDVIQNSSFNSCHCESLLNENGSRLFPRSIFNLTKDFLRCFDTAQVVHLFPNITHLRIGIEPNPPAILNSICTLLQGWASRL